METLIVNINQALDIILRDICRININLHDKEDNAYVILSDLYSIKLRITFIKQLLTGVNVPKSEGEGIKNKIRNLELHLKDLGDIKFEE